MSRRKSKATQPETLESLISGALANKNVYELAKIRRWWFKRFKHPLTTQASPFAVENQQLIIHVSSSTWMHELHYLKAQIVQEIHAAFPRSRVSDVLVRIGPLPASSTASTDDAVPDKKKESLPISEEFARALGRIHDDDVRAAVANTSKKKES